VLHVDPEIFSQVGSRSDLFDMKICTYIFGPFFNGPICLLKIVPYVIDNIRVHILRKSSKYLKSLATVL
jgi:hypothetical protein